MQVCFSKEISFEEHYILFGPALNVGRPSSSFVSVINKLLCNLVVPFHHFNQYIVAIQKHVFSKHDHRSSEDMTVYHTFRYRAENMGYEHELMNGVINVSFKFIILKSIYDGTLYKMYGSLIALHFLGLIT